ncbi:MAG: phage head closure protein [Candidatus Nanoarchaeia archaeon]|jgi:SPP1 family predicted phage head-tail adaptor|nr:phage head closure protein [Candidatus Nanoarchaeia archaeon]
MFFRDVISLISISYSENDYGNMVETETKKTVYADVQAIRQSEFYQANATGLRPEKTFVIRAIEYSNEPRIEYNSKYYTVIRTYDKDGELLELICSEKVGHEVRT